MGLGTNEILVLAIVLIPGMILYFLPTIFAFRKNKESAWGIFALNLLLGWTLLGWIGALIWSLSQEKQLNQNIYINQMPQQGQVNQTSEDTRLCPSCAETIKKQAVKCRYCGEVLVPGVIQ